MLESAIKIFLSYNRQNQHDVKRIADYLSRRGFGPSIEVFFDEYNLAAGDNWVKDIERALTESEVCLIFIGEEGIGGWQNKEALKAVNLCVTSKGTYKIIPVILSYANSNLSKNLPWFLADYQWIELTSDCDQFAMNKLSRSYYQQQAV